MHQVPQQRLSLFKQSCTNCLQAVTKAPAKKLVAGKDIKAQQFKVGEKTISLGFTKSNELFVSRAAMIGVATSIIGEVCASDEPSTTHLIFTTQSL